MDPLPQFPEVPANDAAVMQAALYLASDEASFVTGTEIVVDGGATGAAVGAPVFRMAASQ